MWRKEKQVDRVPLTEGEEVGRVGRKEEERMAGETRRRKGGGRGKEERKCGKCLKTMRKEGDKNEERKRGRKAWKRREEMTCGKRINC